MTRGTFAEFLVQCALHSGGFDALSQVTTGIEAYDFDGPDIFDGKGRRSSRIEVQSTTSLQLNSPETVEALPDAELKFSIKKARDWSSEDPTPHRNNDLYVFCHFTALSKDDNMLDMKFWDFYVLTTFRIEEDKSLSRQKNISVWRLKKLGIPKQSFDTLYEEVMRVVEEISERNA